MAVPWISASPVKATVQKWMPSVVLEGISGFKVWMGTAYDTKPVKVWNGTAWVEKPLKDWTGVTWLARVVAD